MAPLGVDPRALDGAGVSVIDVGKDIGLTLTTLTGALSGSSGMCGDDPVGASMGRSYDLSAQALVGAMTAARNGLCNIGDGVRMSAHNYSVANALSDVSGHTQPLPVPAATGSITAASPPSAVGGGIEAPAGFGWVVDFIGMIWPSGDSAKLRAAAGAWIAAGTSLLTTELKAAAPLSVVAGQQIPEAEAMGQAFATSLSAAGQIMANATTIAAQLSSFADKIDAVHAAIIDLLATICDPLTGVKIVWDFLTGEDEDEIKQIAEDIRTVVDNFKTEAAMVAAKLAPVVDEAAAVASGMAILAEKAWRNYAEGTDPRLSGGFKTQMDKGITFEAAGMVKDLVTDFVKYNPVRMVLDWDGYYGDVKARAEGMAPLVGLGGEGAPGVAEVWKEVGKDTVHWDLWEKNPAEALGRSLFDVGSTVIPFGLPGKVTKVTRALEDAADAVPNTATRVEAPAPPKAPDPPPVLAPRGGEPISAPPGNAPNIPNPVAQQPIPQSSQPGVTVPGAAAPPAPDPLSPGGGHAAHNPPHTGLFDPPANHGVVGGSLPDLGDVNTEFRMPDGAVDPTRFSDWAQRVSEAYPAISKDGVEGIYTYTTENYQGMNPYLRDVDPLSPTQQSILGSPSIADMTPQQRQDWESHIEHTDDGLAALPPYRADPADPVSVTWRGLRASDSILEQLEVGDVFRDPAYVSTSTDSAVAEAFARGADADSTPTLMTVEGLDGVDVAALSRYADESEILFPRGSSFEVVSRVMGEDGLLRIVLRQIGR